jgi:hypothetical protein
MKIFTLHGELNVIPVGEKAITLDFAYTKLTTEYECEPFIPSSKAAAMIGWTTETLERRRRAGEGPAGYVKTGATRGVYPLSEVEKFIEGRKKKR